jgi:hypothetical protein
LALYHRGRFKDAVDVLFGPTATRPTTETSVLGPLFGLYCLFFVGRLRQATRRGTRLLEQAERRGDMHTAVSLHAAPLVDACLVADDPDAAREHVRLAVASWTQRGFHVQHWMAMAWEALIELYVGNGAGAYARLERDRRALRRSLLEHSQSVRTHTAFVRGRAAIASALDAPAYVRRARLAESRDMALRLEREDMVWTAPLASLLRAAAANAEGDGAGASAALREAIERATAADLNLHVWCARRQLGCLIGGEEGVRLMAEADAAMQAEGVRAPARLATAVLPGRWGSRA